jgi:hypothetical protein
VGYKSSQPVRVTANVYGIVGVTEGVCVLVGVCVGFVGVTEAVFVGVLVGVGVVVFVGVGVLVVVGVTV